MLGMSKKDEATVKEGEQILGYDRDNLQEYRAMQEADELIKHKDDKGFRKPSNKDIERAKATVHDYRRKKAETFLEEYKARIKYYGVEIKAFFDEDFFKQTGTIKPSLTIADYNPFANTAPVKPWSEALQENLAIRTNCKHDLSDDTGACKACGLAQEHWGGDKEGVTESYQQGQRAKIAAEREKEDACKRGEHVESENGEHCTNCRKPKEAWGTV